jgi:hypothetical protein
LPPSPIKAPPLPSPASPGTLTHGQLRASAPTRYSECREPSAHRRYREDHGRKPWPVASSIWSSLHRGPAGWWGGGTLVRHRPLVAALRPEFDEAR